jgi:hypothetical protein
MIKKIKNTKPSAIFQLVIVVVLFSYRGCSPENENAADMPTYNTVENGRVSGSASPASGFTAVPFFNAGRAAALSGENGYFFNQPDIFKPQKKTVQTFPAGIPIKDVQHSPE